MIVRVLAFAFILLGCGGCSQSGKEQLVLYTSQDQFYAETILKQFTASTGIDVQPVFDTESAKTAALAHRLRAERSHPQCDVFWSNEELHMRLLVRDGVIASNQWKSAGARTRRVVINTNLLAVADAPKSLLELTNTTWRGRIALAYPLFGTTHSHFLALRQLWGEDLWKNWCAGLVRNEAKVVDGNSVVVRLVGAGECAIGLTDSDDIAAGLRQGMPLAAMETTRESITIPSTVGLVEGARHTDAAMALIIFLSKPETIQRLIEVGALESLTPQPGLFVVNWDEALEQFEKTTAFLKETFLRS